MHLINIPFISYNYDTSQNSFQWGVGQPSLINVGNNNVLIFQSLLFLTYHLKEEYIQTFLAS